MPSVTAKHTSAELHKLYSADLIVDGHVRGIVQAGGRCFVVVGAFGPRDSVRFKGCACVPVQHYQGPLTLRSYHDKCRWIDAGHEQERATFYAGMTFSHRGQQWVLLDEVELVADGPAQLSFPRVVSQPVHIG